MSKKCGNVRAVSARVLLFRNEGTTLLELLITLTISLLLVVFLSGLYVAMNAQHQKQKSLNTLLDASNIVNEILSHDIQLAGYIGCTTLLPLFPLYNTTPYSLTADNKIIVYSEAEGSDVLVVRHRSLSSTVLPVAMENNTELYLSVEFKVAVGDILLISDCSSADIFEVAAITTLSAQEQRLITKQALSRQYSAQAEVGRLEINTYWIGKNAAFNRQDLQGRKVEIQNGLRRMRVFFDLKEGGRVVEQRPVPLKSGSRLAGVSIELELFQGEINKRTYTFICL